MLRLRPGRTQIVLLGVVLSLWTWPALAQVHPGPRQLLAGQVRVSGTIPVFLQAKLLSSPQVEVQLPPAAVPAVGTALQVRVQANSPWRLRVRAEWSQAAVPSLLLTDPTGGATWVLRPGETVAVSPAVPHWAGDQVVTLRLGGPALPTNAAGSAFPVRLAVEAQRLPELSGP